MALIWVMDARELFSMSKAKNIFRFKLNFKHYKKVLTTCYYRTKCLVDVSGSSYVSLSTLNCAAKFYYWLDCIQYTEHNLEDLHEALCGDKCEAACRVAIDIMLGQWRLYLLHLRRQNPSSPHQTWPSPPQRGSVKAYQAISQDGRVSPYNKEISSVFHHRKSRLGNGIHYKSAGEEGDLLNEYDGNEATSGVLERRILASALYCNSFCVTRVAGPRKSTT